MALSLAGETLMKTTTVPASYAFELLLTMPEISEEEGTPFSYTVLLRQTIEL